MAVKMSDEETKTVEDNENPSNFRRNCDQCVLKKIKCDGCKPCSLCSRKGAECVYSAKRKPGPKTRHCSTRSLSNSSEEFPSKRLRQCRVSRDSEQETDTASTASPIPYRFRRRPARYAASESNEDKNEESSAVIPKVHDGKGNSMQKMELRQSAILTKKFSGVSLKSASSFRSSWSSYDDDSDEDFPYSYMSGSRLAAELIFAPKFQVSSHCIPERPCNVIL